MKVLKGTSHVYHYIAAKVEVKIRYLGNTTALPRHQKEGDIRKK